MRYALDSSSNTWPENFSAHRNKAIQGLIQGRELTNQLRVVLGNPFCDDEPAKAGDLVAKILVSFTETISMLNRCATGEVSDQIPARIKSEDSDESSKTSGGLKERRGCYKRRKTSQTSTRITPTLIDDGHAWRKYGQKVILNAKHPRNYFRCTHKFDQGCQATKQVQKTEDDPAAYRTTYHGHHTCRNLHKSPPHIFFDSTPSTDNSLLFSFGASSNINININNNNQIKSHEPFFPSNNFPLMKQEEEYKEDDRKPSVLDQYNQSSSSDYLLSPDLTTFESSGPLTVLSSGSDHGDVISSSGVYSCTASTHSHSLSFDMDDIMVGPVDFGDDFLAF